MASIHPLTPFKIRNLGPNSPTMTINGVSVASVAANLQALKYTQATLFQLSVINTSGAAVFLQVFNAIGGTGATVTFVAAGGIITSVTAIPAAGGAGYPPSATVNLPVAGGVGGIVAATTNASGVITAFALVAGVTSGYTSTTAGVGVILGTTTPDYEIQIAATSQGRDDLPRDHGQGFNVGICVAATTAEGGGSASASGVMVTGNFT